MRLSRLTLFLYTISLLLFSCEKKDPNKQIDEGIIKGEIYKSKEIGWEIRIPSGWSVVSRDVTQKSEEKGQNAVEQSTGQKFDLSSLKHLISFQKNQFNMFASTSEPFMEEFPGEYEENNKNINSLIYQTFIDQGIKADSSSGQEVIQGIKFNTFYTTIYAPDGKVILNQILYSKLINGYDFGVNINYNNEEDKKTMIDAWKKSKFEDSLKKL